MGLGLFVVACTREYIENVNGVCFQQEVLPIFVSNCTQSGCHNSTDREDGYDLTSYATIIRDGIEPGNYAESELYQVLIKPGGEDLMPPSPHAPLSESDISMIALWIQTGAENTSCSTTTCDTVALSYTADVRPLLQTYCLSCHTGSTASGGVDYAAYSGVKAGVTDGSLIGSISHASGFSPMPQNGNKLSACQIATVQAWISQGALNN